MPSADRIYLCHCHDEKAPGKTVGGWSERRLATVVNEALCLTLRDGGPGESIWPILRGTLASRISTLRELPVAPVVEVHFDSLDSRPAVDGYFTIVSETNREAHLLGEAILSGIGRAFPSRRNMGLCKANEAHRWVGTNRQYDGQRLALLCDLPHHASVIVEACFLTNPEAFEWIQKIESRLLLGAAIGRGILDYCQSRNAQLCPKP